MEAINFNKQKRDQGVEDVKFIVNLIFNIIIAIIAANKTYKIVKEDDDE